MSTYWCCALTHVADDTGVSPASFNQSQFARAFLVANRSTLGPLRKTFISSGDLVNFHRGLTVNCPLRCSAVPGNRVNVGCLAAYAAEQSWAESARRISNV